MVCNKRILWIWVLFIMLAIISFVYIIIEMSSQNTKFEIILIDGEEKERLISLENESDITFVDALNQKEWINFSNYTFSINLEIMGEKDYLEKVKTAFNPGAYCTILGNSSWNRTLVLIGDSFSEGSGVGINETFGAFLAKKGIYKTVNLAHGGFNTLLEVKSLENTGLNFSPDYVVLQYFVNDYENPLVLYTFWNTVFDILDSNGVKYDSYQVGQGIYDYYGRIYFPRHKEEHYSRFIQEPLEKLEILQSEFGFEIILIYLPVFIPEFNYGEEVLKFALLNGWKIINLGEEINFSYSPPFTISERNIHFSKMTHKKIASLLSSIIPQREV